MRTATGLALVGIGAILAFAVTTSPFVINLQSEGWVLIVVGVAGMAIPRRGYGYGGGWCGAAVNPGSRRRWPGIGAAG